MNKYIFLILNNDYINNKKEEYVTNNVTNIYEKVRMKNIERFLQYNSERISAS
mgnify:CR=1 FL=1